jgi:hypothetical protein
MFKMAKELGIGVGNVQRIMKENQQVIVVT